MALEEFVVVGVDTPYGMVSFEAKQCTLENINGRYFAKLKSFPEVEAAVAFPTGEKLFLVSRINREKKEVIITLQNK